MTNSLKVWLVANSDGSYVNGVLYETEYAAKDAIKWDYALSGCVAIPATVSYDLPSVKK